MNAMEVIELVQESLFLLLRISAPVMLVALVVGLSIALFQALTQIQEMTLTFVPKIISIFLALILFLPFMLEGLINFTEGLADRIIAIEANDDPDVEQ